MPGEIRLNLENIGCVNTNGGKGGDDGKDTDMFFVHGILQFVADFKNHSPGRMDSFIKTIRLIRQGLYYKSFAVAWGNIGGFGACYFRPFIAVFVYGIMAF